MRRQIVTVSYSKRSGWTWKGIGGQGGRDTKAEAVREAVELCRSELRRNGIRSELRIKGKDGKIQDCRTYGEDPRRTKG